MNCQKCRSQNCRSFEIIHQSGTSLFYGMGSMQTDLAKRCSPPKNNFRILINIIAMIMGLIAVPLGCIAVWDELFPSHIGWGMLSMLIAVGITFYIFALIPRLLGVTQRHENAMHNWKNSFMCLDCGHQFIHQV